MPGADDCGPARGEAAADGVAHGAPADYDGAAGQAGGGPCGAGQRAHSARKPGSDPLPGWHLLTRRERGEDGQHGGQMRV